MKHNYLLFSCHHLLKKYRKYFSRLQNHLHKGTFRSMAPRKKNFLLKKVEELRARLLQLQPKLAGTVAATALLTALNMTSANAQNPTFALNNAKNPFASSVALPLTVQSNYSWTSPAAGDLDGDGDFDIVVSNSSSLYCYENTGTNEVPEFTERTGEDNPFSSDNGVSVENSYPVLVLTDLDGDGDLDLLAGGRYEDYGQIITYYKNVGTPSNPSFVQQTGSDNPFPALSGYTGYGSPAVADIDGDGDLDVFVADSYYGRMFFLENTGSATNPVFVENSVDNPFPDEDLSTDGSEGGYLQPSFVDIDGDGDLDAVMGQYDEQMLFYKNTGTATAPVMELQLDADNPFSQFVFYWAATAFADMDNDGDLDMVLGNDDETKLYYNSGTATEPEFIVPSTSDHVKIRLVDIDGDGDQDAVFTTYDETPFVRYMVNNGPAAAPTFTEQTGEDNPFENAFSPYSNAFADLDGDSDFDFLASIDGGIYYENIGTSTSPEFEENPEGNPFSSLNVEGYTYAFVDLDNDGDQDLVTNGYAGEAETGYANYYKNTGTSTAPVFEMQTGVDNPFDAIPFQRENYFTFVNFDGDGDYDLVIGTEYFGILYYQNTGSASSPVFEEQTGVDNPFEFINESEDVEGAYYSTAFMDGDADGDLDLLVCEYDGTITFYENQSTVTGLFGNRNVEEAVSAYPNPVRDVLHFTLNSAKSSNVQVSVMDMTGSEVLSQSQAYSGLSNINVSSLQPGIYTLRVSSEAQVAVVKFVKQ